MPKFLRKLEFEKVIKALWDKSKEKFVEEITFDDTIDTATNKPKNKLSKTKGGQESVVVDHVVTEWMDLDYTTQSSIKNIFDKNTQVEEDKAYSFSNISTNTGCRIVKIPCSAGDTFTIVKSATLDSKQVGVYNANGNHIRHLDANGQIVNGKAVYRFTIPNDLQDSSYFVNSMYKDHTDINSVMVFKENVANNNIPTNYVPFTDGATVLIDSSEVALSFNGTGTNLSSSTIHSAIKELNGKISNAGGGTVTSVNNVQPVNGDVTININNIPNLQDSLNNKVDTSLVGNDTNKIPQLNNGKLVDTIIPELAITRIVDVTDQADALAKVNNKTIQVGDSVRLIGDNNKVYQYTGKEPGVFTDRFIEISLGDATVRTVNNQKPTLGGNVTVNAGQINASVGNHIKSVQDHMNEMHTNISNARTIANENRAKINVLETKQPYYNVGDIVPTFKNSGDGYKVAGCTFMYCGTSRVLSRTDYPDFCNALGYSASTTRFDTPVIRDESILITNGKYATKRYYVCIKNN